MPPAPPGKKRKQRSPFYTKVSKDGTKQKQGRSKYWCLSIWTRTGAKSDRTREFYSTLKKAKEAQENAIRLNRTEGLAAVEISTQLRIEAIRAADILKGRASLTEAAQYFMKHAAPSNEVTVRQLYKKYHDFQEAEGASVSYMADIKWRMKRFAESFPKSKMAHEVKYSEITAYLSKAFVRKGRAGDKRIKAQVPRKLSPAGRRIELKNNKPWLRADARSKVTMSTARTKGTNRMVFMRLDQVEDLCDFGMPILLQPPCQQPPAPNLPSGYGCV